jgi:hypothetical protein
VGVEVLTEVVKFINWGGAIAALLGVGALVASGQLVLKREMAKMEKQLEESNVQRDAYMHLAIGSQQLAGRAANTTIDVAQRVIKGGE